MLEAGIRVLIYAGASSSSLLDNVSSIFGDMYSVSLSSLLFVHSLCFSTAWRPTQTKVEIGTSQSKIKTYAKSRQSGFFWFWER